MNKTLYCSLAAAAVFFLCTNALAGSKNGGFYGPTADSASVTVEQAKQMSDESFVVLRGKVKQMVGKEKYLFEDQSGSIVIEIDDEDWNGVTVGPDDIVEIRGEVDTHWNKPTDIEVDSIAISLKK